MYFKAVSLVKLNRLLMNESEFETIRCKFLDSFKKFKNNTTREKDKVKVNISYEELLKCIYFLRDKKLFCDESKIENEILLIELKNIMLCTYSKCS